MKVSPKLAMAPLLLTQLVACTLVTPLKNPNFEPVQPIQDEIVSSNNGTIYSDTNNRFLFEDIKARRIGDLITVLLEESTNATKSASTNTAKKTSIGMPSPTIFGMNPSYKGKNFLSNLVNSDGTFNGSGDSTQSNKLKGNITVTIAQVYPNGNMLVRGEKFLTLNQGSEVVRIAGLVRPADISPNNEIKSTHIANAEITYSGRGPLADSNSQGWLTRILGGPLWPF